MTRSHHQRQARSTRRFIPPGLCRPWRRAERSDRVSVPQFRAARGDVVRRALERTDRLQPACPRDAGAAGARAGWLEAKILVHDADLEPEAIAAVAASGPHIQAHLPRRSRRSRGGLPRDRRNDRALRRRGEPPRPADIAAIVFSSGTTGKPKGIMHTQKTLLEAAKGGQVMMGPITSDSATLFYMQPSFAAWPSSSCPLSPPKPKSVSARHSPR